MRRRSLVLGLGLLLALAAPALAASGDDPERQARWTDLRQSIFGDRQVLPGGELITIEAPARALDASLVPITLRTTDKERVTTIHLVIDDNPSPYAAKVGFGPAGDPALLRLRVRIDGYTNVHAIAETADGRLYGTSVFVKASGGCSAPIGVTDEQAMQGMGEMRLKLAGDADEATLMIRHPNFNGMQMNQVTRNYTPARYLDDIRISRGGQTVIDVAGDISLSTDPVIGFRYAPGTAGAFDVQAKDSDGGHWQRSFPAPGMTN